MEKTFKLTVSLILVVFLVGCQPSKTSSKNTQSFFDDIFQATTIKSGKRDIDQLKEHLQEDQLKRIQAYSQKPYFDNQ